MLGNLRRVKPKQTAKRRALMPRGLSFELLEDRIAPASLEVLSAGNLLATMTTAGDPRWSGSFTSTALPLGWGANAHVSLYHGDYGSAESNVAYLNDPSNVLNELVLNLNDYSIPGQSPESERMQFVSDWAGTTQGGDRSNAYWDVRINPGADPSDSYYRVRMAWEGSADQGGGNAVVRAHLSTAYNGTNVVLFDGNLPDYPGTGTDGLFQDLGFVIKANEDFRLSAFLETTATSSDASFENGLNVSLFPIKTDPPPQPVSRPDIAMQSAQVTVDDATPPSRRVVNFSYTVQGGNESQPFHVQVYRSTNQTFDPADLASGATFAVGSPLTLSGNDLSVGPHSGQIILPTQLDFDPLRPYVLVVADPGQQVSDSDRTNNSAFVAAFDILLGNVPYYNQASEPWGHLYYLNTTDHISTSGCALSDLAMALTYAGIQETPETLNTLLYTKTTADGEWGYTGAGRLVFETATQIAVDQAAMDNSDPSLRQVRFHEVTNETHSATELANLLVTDEVPVIVQVEGANGPHYVLVTGTDGRDFDILDPGHRANNDSSLFSAYGQYFTIRGYVQDPLGDLSSFTAAVDARGDGANLLVTDPLGRRTGYDPATGQVLMEIPGSAYNTDEFEIDPDGTPSGTVLRSVYIFQPQPGAFHVEIIPGASGPANLLLAATDTAGRVTPSVIQTISSITNSEVPFDASFGANGQVKLAPTVAVTDAGGTYNGNPFPASATATGVAGVPASGDLSFSYYVGSSVSGTGSEMAPTDAGTFTVVASFTSADANYANAQSAPVTFTIAKATPSFSLLSSPALILGTNSATLSGRISLGSLVPMGSATVILNAVSKSVAINPDGTFSALFNSGALGVGAYRISYSYGGDSNFTAATGESTLSVTYNVTVLFGKSKPKKAGSTIRVKIELTNADGQNVSSPNTAVTALGIASVLTPDALLPADGPGNSNPGHRFKYSAGRYRYKFKTPKTLAGGTYLFYFTIDGDPLIHSVQFELK